MPTRNEVPTRRPILVVLHQEHSSAGRVGQLLVGKGFPLDIRRPVLGQDLPDTLAQHAGAVVFGGPMSANDPDEFIRKEIDWLKVPLDEERPFLGICLGAQMLVRHLGCKVAANPDGATEIGWYPLRPTEQGRRLINWPQMVYHFHREGFELPKGAELLAQGDAYPNQAFRYGKAAWGVQFHAELTRVMMQRWIVRGADKFTLPNAQNGKAHLEGRMIFDAPLKTWLDEFLDLVFADEQQQAIQASSSFTHE